MDFTSRQFRAFLLVAQHRSFSRAAEALYITPSGLSVLIRELEVLLGFRLFDRTTRHVGLTKYGSELLGVVRHSLERVDATVSRIGRSATQANLSLSVAAPPLIAANVLPEAIKEFRSHRPGLDIRVFDVGGDALTRLVEDGQVDMSLGGFFKPALGIRRTPLFRFSLMVIRPDQRPRIASHLYHLVRSQGRTAHLVGSGQSRPGFHRQASGPRSRCHPSPRYLQPSRHNDRHGRGRRRRCHHPFLRIARLPQSKGCNE